MSTDHDEITDAKSAPVSTLQKLCTSGNIAIAGCFADLLSSQIAPGRQTWQFFPGTPDEVISSAGFQNEFSRIVIREALPAIMPKVDNLVLADRNWASAVCNLRDGFQRLRAKVTSTIVFPVQLKHKQAAWCWHNGCSYPESFHKSQWIWTDSETPEMEAEFQSSDRTSSEIFLKYQIVWPENCKGEVIVSQPLATTETLDLRREAQRHAVQLIDGRAIIKWRTNALPRRLPNDPRLISFGIKDLQITDAHDNVILAAPEIYAAPSQPQSSPYEESGLRRALHHAGFPRVGGWILAPGRPDAGRRMAISSGAPGFDQVHDVDTHKSCVDSLVHKHEIAWIIAQARPYLPSAGL